MQGNIKIFKYFLLSLFIIFILLLNSKYIFYRVRETSMNPTLIDGDLIIVKKVANKTKLNRGTVIVFRAVYEPKLLIKRISLLESDTICQISTKSIMSDKINLRLNSLQHYFTTSEINELAAPESLHITVERNIIPESYYYVLGDNRNKSIDSRFFGLINKNQIIGKVLGIWSNKQFRFINP